MAVLSGAHNRVKQVRKIIPLSAACSIPIAYGAARRRNESPLTMTRAGA
jgi:hypothetical protein